MKSTLRGKEFTVSAEEVEKIAANLSPEPLRKHGIVVCGRRFPPKQLLEAVLEAKGIKMSRLAYTSDDGYYLFTRLGFLHMRVDDREGGLQVLKKLTGIVALGGDAVVDSKNYHD